ncbi:MAG TPA: xyloglucanase, partial [Polyangiaceae bacterium]
HSSDSGKSFRTLANVEEAYALGFGRAAPGQTYPALYLSGKIGGVTGFFRSDDVAASFVRINDDEHQYGGSFVITGDPRVYGRVYLGPPGRGVIVGEPK